MLAVCALGAVLLSMSGLKLVRRFVPRELLQPHHNVAGWFLSIAGTLYAVVLGFIVVDALNDFQQARITVEQEANGLHDIFHLSRGLTEPANQEMRGLCMSYARAVATDEWQTMENGEASPNAHQLMARMWHTMTAYKANNDADQDFHAAILEEMRIVGDARHTRLLGATPSYDPVLWFVLIVGAAVTVIFTYFFGLDNENIQLLMTALIAVILSLNIILVSLFGSPFSGDVKVPARPFENDVKYFLDELHET
jgi:hypothetical protein